MTFMNNDANIRSFHLIKFLNENCSDDHIISRISIVLRRDKPEAPYYMVIKIKLSTCIDKAENGLIHAMDVLNHQRMYNLTEERYDEIKSLIINGDYDFQGELSKDDMRLKLVLMSKNDEEFTNLFKTYAELFEKIDSLVD